MIFIGGNPDSFEALVVGVGPTPYRYEQGA